MIDKTLAVIIPNYNKSYYIKYTIESILNQSFLPNEIIIVDDCSTDCSKQIIQEYAQKFPHLIKPFFLDKNQGVQHARNYGVQQVSSQYITFVDSDDIYYNKDKLRNEVKAVNKNNIVFSKYCFISTATGEASFPNYNRFDEHLFDANAMVCYINYKYMVYWPFGYIVHIDNFKKIGGYNFPVNLYEDLDILIKYKQLGLKFNRTRQYGYGIRQEANDVSHLSSNNKDKPFVDQELLKRYSKYINKTRLNKYAFYCFLSKQLHRMYRMIFRH